MKKNNPYNGGLMVRRAVTKMLQIAGYDKTVEEMTSSTWFQDHTMTSVQEAEFKKWFIEDYKKANRYLASNAAKVYDWFNLTYGLKIKD